MQAYQDVVSRVLAEGTRKPNRTGVDTLSAFNINYEVDLLEGFPLLTGKEVSWKNIVVENLWFLSGAQHIGLLRKHGCKFWEPWADAEGYVPSAYGAFWRGFGADALQAEAAKTVEIGPNPGNDQMGWVVQELRRNPDSRRLVVSAWDPNNAQQSALPPCHLLMVWNVQRAPNGEPELNLHLTQRSCDVALGLPYNIAGYALLLHLVGQMVGIKPRRFAHTLVDAHIYTAKADGSMSEYDHVPGLQEQLTRPQRALPTLNLDPSFKELDDLTPLLHLETADLMTHFELKDYNPHPAIRFKVAV